MLQEVVDQEISHAPDNIKDSDIKNADDIEIGEEDDGSERSAEMKNTLRVTFKSDRISKWHHGSREYRLSNEPETEQGKAIQELLETYKAYDFLDRNYLGYLLRGKERDDYPFVHFLKSTSPTVDGDGQDQAAIFIAIEWTDDVEKTIKKYALGKGGGTLAVNPVQVGNKHYQIIGVATFDKENSSPEVIDAFSAFLHSVNREINPKLKEAGETGEAFILSEKMEEKSKIDTVFTGRLDKKNDQDDNGSKVSLHEFMTSQQGDDSRSMPTEFNGGMEFYFGIVVNGGLNTTQEESATSIMEPVNDTWAKNHNGAIVMYVPKPDGKLYPVRCIRRTVADWLKKDADGHRNGEELLNAVLSGEVKNEYLGNIINYLNILFDEEATISDRMFAKQMLHKYFILGDSTVHFNGDEISINFGKDSEYIEGETPEEKIGSFFNILRDHEVMFTIPTPSIEKINGREIINSGVLEIRLRGFYNFNANFTIEPIDGNGTLITVSDKNDGEAPLGSANINRNVRTYDFGDGVKDYYIESDGSVTLDGEPVSDDIANLIRILDEISKGTVPQYTVEVVGNKYKTPEAKTLVLDSLHKFDGVYIIHAQEDWVYDSRKANHNERVYKLNSTNGETLKNEVEQAITQFATSHSLEIRNLEKGTNVGVQENRKTASLLGDGVLIEDSADKSLYEINLEDGTFIPTASVKDLKSSSGFTSAISKEGVPLSKADGYSVKKPGRIESVAGGGYRIVEKAVIETYAKEAPAAPAKPATPTTAKTGMFAGKTLATLDERNGGLEGWFASNRKTPIVKGSKKLNLPGLFDLVQSSTEPIDEAKLLKILKDTELSDREKYTRAVDEINGCHKG